MSHYTCAAAGIVEVMGKQVYAGKHHFKRVCDYKQGCTPMALI